MGLDKKKKIVVREQFKQDLFYADNAKLSTQVCTSLPTQQEDILIAKNQSVFFSIEHALKRLVQNDKYIDQFLSRKSSGVACAVENGLLSALSADSNLSSPPQLSVFENELCTHIQQYHIPSTTVCALSTVNNNYLDNDMSNIDMNGARRSFQNIQSASGTMINYGLSTYNSIQLSNDVVINYEFDDSPTVYSPTNYINVAVCNKMTSNTFNQSMRAQATIAGSIPNLTECKYIYKEWMSGFKELYIYVPTTYTFYNENIDGEDVNKNATWIQVKINSRHFKFNHIYQANICGQSLPMQIHNTINSHFNDVILPSMLRTMSISNEPTNNASSVYDEFTSQYILYFVCYGTDAQAIQIFGD